MERILDKLDEISRQLQELGLRVARLEPVADSHKDLSAKVAVLETKIVALETKLAVWSSLAAAGGGGLGLAMAKLFGN